jgi:methylmalonyl-CoA/ethylmalonyl-CoA epimerase
MFTLDHVAIVVPELEAAVATYCQLLDYPPAAVRYHEVPSEGVRVAMLKGNTTLELLQSTDPAGSLARFIEKRGPGLHHLCFAVDEAQPQLDRLLRAGLSLLDTTPRVGAEGAVFFVHPRSAAGVLTEFVEKPATPVNEE